MAVANQTSDPVGFWRLAIGYFGAAVAWTFHLLVAMALVPVACEERAGEIALYVVSGVALVVALASAAVAFTNWRSTDHESRREGGRRPRSHFLGLTGIVASIVFAAGIVFATVPILVLGPCESTI